MGRGGFFRMVSFFFFFFWWVWAGWRPPVIPVWHSKLAHIFVTVSRGRRAQVGDAATPVCPRLSVAWSSLSQAETERKGRTWAQVRGTQGDALSRSSALRPDVGERISGQSIVRLKWISCSPGHLQTSEAKRLCVEEKRHFFFIPVPFG